MKRIIPAIATACLVMVSNVSTASDFDEINALPQEEFRLFSEDLAAAVSYKSVSPGEALGITGFDIALEVTGTKMKNVDRWWSLATGGNTSITSTLPVTRVHAHKGLPFGFDIGFSISKIPSSNVDATGGEIRYAIIDGGVAMPAIAFRVTSSRINGMDQLRMTNIGYEFSISKGFIFFTPYAGIGQIKTESEPKGTAAVALVKESFTDTKTFVGVNMNFGLFNMGLESDKTGDSTSYTLKFGFRW